MPVRTQKEAAALVLSVKADTGQAKKELQDLLRLAASVGNQSRNVFATSARQQISIDRERAASAQHLAREVAKTEREVARAAKAKTDALAAEWRREKQIRDEQERAARRAGAGGFASQFRSAISSSRVTLPGTGGIALPLVNRLMTPGGAAAGLLTAAAGGAGALASNAIKQAADLEEALNLLQVRTRASGADLERLRLVARDLGADMRLPATSSVDAANAMAALSSRGQDLESAMKGARGALQLAAVAGVDAGEAARFAGDMVNAFGLRGEETTRVANALAKALNLTGASAQELQEGFAQATAAYAQAGFSLEDLSRDMIAMYQAGIRGSDAGTSLRTAIIRLTAPTKEARAEFKRLGVEVFDAAGNIKGHDEIVRALAPALARLSDEARSAAVQTIFGADAMRAANVVFGMGADKLGKLADRYAQAANAAQTADANSKGLKGALDGLSSAWDTFAEKRGTGVIQGLTDLVRLVGLAIDRVDTLVSSLEKVNGIRFDPMAGVRAIVQESEATKQTGRASGQAAIAQRDIGILQNLQDYFSPAKGEQRSGILGIFDSADVQKSRNIASYQFGISPFNRQQIREIITRYTHRWTTYETPEDVAEALRLAQDIAGRAGKASYSDVLQDFYTSGAHLQKTDKKRGGANPPSAADLAAAQREKIRRAREAAAAAGLRAQAAQILATMQAQGQQNSFSDLLDNIGRADTGGMLGFFEGNASEFIAGERKARLAAANEKARKTAIGSPGDSPAHAAARKELAEAQRRAEIGQAERFAQERRQQLKAAIEQAEKRILDAQERIAGLYEKEAAERSDAERKRIEGIRAVEEARFERESDASQALQKFLSGEQERIEIQRQSIDAEEARLEDIGRVDRLEKLMALLLEEHANRIKSLLESRAQSIRDALREGEDLRSRLLAGGVPLEEATRQRDALLKQRMDAAMGAYNQGAASEYGRFEISARDVGEQKAIAKIAQELRDDVNTPWGDEEQSRLAQGLAEATGEALREILPLLLSGRLHDRQTGGALLGVLKEKGASALSDTVEESFKIGMKTGFQPLKEALGKLGINIKAGAEGLGQAALALYSVTALLGAQGRKKQQGAVIGGAFGAAIGSAFGAPVLGFEIGSAAGAAFSRAEAAGRSDLGDSSGGSRAVVMNTYIDAVHGVGDLEQIGAVLSRQVTDRMGAR